MDWKSPCAKRDPDCPYAAWLASPSLKLTRIRRYGTDRYGRQRFQCVIPECRRTFYRPPDRDDKIGFKEYRRIEVQLAHSQGESFGMIARRLGLARSTVVRWIEQWRQPRVAGTAPHVPANANLRAGRVARLVQALEPGDAPYVVAQVDAVWFIKASVAEMLHFLENREYPEVEADRSLVASVEHREAPIEARLRALEQIGQHLRQRFHQELELTARPAKRVNSRRTTR